ncbi:IclR family transcriptional regulator [Denitrobaculum tricleocarpae]|uniref:IclR family transcriptional regulator n=1 Tax=Denitrobaculum tricleocarpae TaxID=2591009 RepID=A0A545T7X0_9PROT|nr:IclR family transcriptional regulator [Denitrobaculum tricleocarpae]TQV73319.1 IclR family transcriptional regulator [Denitrobaculum tricleocarpae]
MTKLQQSSIVHKCAQILDVLAHARRPLAYMEIVEKTGFVKSSAHRILAVMEGEGLVEKDASLKAYRLGPKLSYWAQTAWRKTDLQDVAGAELEAFCEKNGYNVALSIRDDDKVLYLRTLDSVPVRYASRAGERAPLHCTAAGKVFLAHMSESQQDRLMGELKFERLTENTIVSAEVLKRELKLTRLRGYGTADREESLQVAGVAAPILDTDRAVMAAVSIWCPVAQAGIGELQLMAPELLEMTKRISAQMGHHIGA